MADNVYKVLIDSPGPIPGGGICFEALQLAGIAVLQLPIPIVVPDGWRLVIERCDNMIRIAVEKKSGVI